MDTLTRMKDLIDKLNFYSKKYYAGDPVCSDKDWDSMLEDLKALEKSSGIIMSNSPTVNVGTKVIDKLNKVNITDKPMLSLDKVHSAEEVVKFSDGYDILGSIKCDGLSVRIIYKNGKLVSANTRGDGYIGGDITEHIKQFLNVPLSITREGKYIVDGEAVILKKDFDKINKNNDFKNQRNAAAGSLNLLDMSIVKDRRLSFIAWDVIEGADDRNCYHYRLEDAEYAGFDVVPAFAIDCTKVDIEEIDEINQNLIDCAKKEGIPCDGIVWKINDIKAGDAKGSTAHHFLNAVAWKPANEEYETELLDIELSMGRTGVLTPVAIFKPVDIDGSTVERASLHNVSIMKEILSSCPYKGQKIWVYKANLIIPQISRAEYGGHPKTNDIFKNDEVTLCPICGEPLDVEESESGVLNFVCNNKTCEGKLANKIDHFVGKKGLDIKGLSIKTIEKLIDWGWINELTDIFKLDQHRTEWISKEGFGAVSVGKLLDAIDEARFKVNVNSFISAIGIPLVGKTIAKEIVEYYPTWKGFRDAVGSDWTQFEGFGPEISSAINKFDYAEADEIAGMLAFLPPQGQKEDQTTATPLKDKTFVITGKVNLYKNRDELKAEIESLGGKVASSVSSKTDYLINNDNTSTTAKNKKAKELNIPIITEEEYQKLKTNAEHS